MFEDRKDAGQQLARALEPYKDEGVLVLAIPKGGAEVGYEVADHLDAEFAFLIARKLPYPNNPEAGFGAVAEDGSLYVSRRAATALPDNLIQVIIDQQREEIERRIEVLRQGRPLPSLKERTVILVDDGIAAGSTMRAAIALCRNQYAGKIVVAAPVSGESVARDLEEMVDEVVILEQPPFFRAVAQVYEKWYDVSDEEAIEILERWRNRHAPQTS
ncbi:MAG: phosphoribosyltransferase [Anaerolineales bacterium]